jgi:hypothetical protein
MNTDFREWRLSGSRPYAPRASTGLRRGFPLRCGPVRIVKHAGPTEVGHNNLRRYACGTLPGRPGPTELPPQPPRNGGATTRNPEGRIGPPLARWGVSWRRSLSETLIFYLLEKQPRRNRETSRSRGEAHGRARWPLLRRIGSLALVSFQVIPRGYLFFDVGLYLFRFGVIIRKVAYIPVGALDAGFVVGVNTVSSEPGEGSRCHQPVEDGPQRVDGDAGK